LRQPTPIHAAQCFVAAGLQKFGCSISLWIDDLGRKEYSTETFINRLKSWYGKAGGDLESLKISKFSEILNSEKKHVEPAWQMLQKWLGTMAYYTDHILKVSKIWPVAENQILEDPEKVLGEFSKRRPCRLMTPSMVWTCLNVLSNDHSGVPFLTLGGYDEKSLWDAWRTCCELPKIQVGHLYIPKLTHKTSIGEITIHMSDKPLAWDGKEDIEKELKDGLSESGNTHIWSQFGSIIPWAISNCVLLPNFVTKNAGEFRINGNSIYELNQLTGTDPSLIIGEIIEAVRAWII
jgi:hypothetical protein